MINIEGTKEQREAEEDMSSAPINDGGPPGEGRRSVSRILFITLEVQLGLGWLGLALVTYVLPRFSGLSEAVEAGCGVAVMVAWPILFFVAPFFLRKMRRVALVGWFMAFVMVLWGLTLPAIA